MSWLLESPLWIITIGVAVIAILGGGWLKTGHKAFVVLLAIAILLTTAMAIIERLVVTDREAIAAKLSQMSRDVEKNDLRLVMSHVHSKAAPSVVSRIQSEFPSQNFRQVHVTKINKIEVFRDRRPPRAVAYFFVSLEGDFYNGRYPKQRVVLSVELEFLEEKGEWQVSNYSYELAQNALFGKSSP